MITGKEYLKKHVGETNIPEEHYENEIGEIMDWYAEYYHQEKVKNLALCDVSQQRELLIAFANYIKLNNKKLRGKKTLDLVDYFIAINCG